MRGRLSWDTCKSVQLTPLINGNIKIGQHVHILNKISCGGKLEIGDYSNFNGDNTFYIHDNYKISFGKFCSIAGGVCFIASVRHDYSILTTYTYEFVPDNFKAIGKNISIGHDVWIGRNAIILKGVNIGTGAVIGAGSVVTKDIPPYAIAVGNPAKVIKYRFNEETIKKLLSSERWDRDIEKIKSNYYLEFIR